MARDLTCSLVLAAIAVVYYLLASSIGASALADEVGPAGLPLAYAVLLGAVALLLAAKTALEYWLARAAVAPQQRSGPGMGFVLRRAAGALAIGAGYVAIVDVIGYWLALGLLIPAMALYQGRKLGRGLIVISITAASAFWLLFVWLLDIPMPGPWIP
ncbi:MAG TPA: tripartite tricarboxylate transporter TctB family protein [Gammaproteobacteria bacterium]